MHAILHRAQTNIGSWVGSAAIHMGDHNVPNALMFIGNLVYRSTAIPTNGVNRQILASLPNPPSDHKRIGPDSEPNGKTSNTFLH